MAAERPPRQSGSKIEAKLHGKTAVGPSRAPHRKVHIIEA